MMIFVMGALGWPPLGILEVIGIDGKAYSIPYNARLRALLCKNGTSTDMCEERYLTARELAHLLKHTNCYVDCIEYVRETEE